MHDGVASDCITAEGPPVLMPELPILPVSASLPALVAALEAGTNALLIAPPGAGKTTLAPLALLDSAWRGDGMIVLVEPRRVAARAAARRMAALIGEEAGGLIGFRTRTDQAVSARTRIEVVTEGLLVRRLLGDPTLDGTTAIIFDEVHERALDLDLALALALDLQRSLRPELRLLAMSATMDGARLATLMDAPIIESEGRMFPVDIRHSPRDLLHPRDLPDAVARAARAALAEHEGDILCFLPGVGEIARARSALADVRAEVLPLHGELAATEQDRVLRPGGNEGRRIILATSIAETSLTVPGVRIVIDGGLRRAPRLEPSTGLPKLQTLKISRATAEQRAGRAGREGPGVAIRLWSDATHRAMTPHDRPEILDADLSGLCLDLAAWRAVMGTEPADLSLPDAPPGGMMEGARTLLQDLGGLDGDGRITAHGTAMARLGAHPRLAAMMLAARTPGEGALACDIAALLEERDPLRPRPGAQGRPITPPADIALRLDLVAGGAHPDADRASLARIRQAAGQYRRRLRVQAEAEGDPAALLAAAFPDRVAQRRGDPGSFRLSGGGSAKLGRDDRLANSQLLAVASLQVRTAAEIRLAAPLDPENLPPALLDRTTQSVETALDTVTGSVMARRRLRLGGLVLRDRTVAVDADEAATLLLQQVLSAPDTSLNWTDAAVQFRARLGLARERLDRADLPDPAALEPLLAPWLSGLKRMSDVRALDMLSVLRSGLDHASLVWLDRSLPTHLDLPGGRTAIDYTGTTPAVSARAQHFYGLKETPKLGDGRIELQFALLSPAGRPQAITADLAGFWRGGWADMRRDMRGRYPRHDWPEDPASASPPAPRRRP